MSKTIATSTEISTAQNLETSSNSLVKDLNDMLRDKWLNDALTFEDAWYEHVLINWRFWLNFPIWVREDAAHLFFGICPIKVKSADIPAEVAISIIEFIKMAEANDMNNLSPSEWRAWGEEKNFESQGGLKAALSAFTSTERAELELLSKIPREILKINLQNNTLPTKIIHKINKRTRILDAEIGSAKLKALDPLDPNSIWAELLKLAEQGIGCLVGIGDQGDIKYRIDADIRFFKFKNLRDRMSR